MLKHPTQTSERVKQFTDSFADQFYLEEVPVKITVFSAPDRIPFAEAVKGRFRPAQEGEKFGPRWSTHWFKLEIEIPKSWCGREVHLRFQSVSEALVWSATGQPLQGLVSANWGGEWAGFDDIRSHYALTKQSKGGEKFTLYVEAAITALMGFGMTKVKPEETDPGIVGELKLCRIAVFDREAWDLSHDLRTMDLIGRQLPEKHHLRLRANTAGNAIANTINPADRSTWPAAREIAAAFFADNAGPRRFNVSAVGHAHIDTAWLWPIAETIRKCARSFVSQLRLIEEYPEHKFVCSQAQQLVWVKERYPTLFSELKKQAAAGRFIPCGGTWIEPDCNIPSGESLVRQFLLGQRFYEREFGRRCREFWNPDVFGYSGAMPQIMKGAGIDYFLTQKLSWNQFNKPVSSTFLWEGIDGTQVLTHFPPSDTYNGTGDPGELLSSMENHKDAERSREACYLFGFGDGGGGPTATMLEKLRRQQGLDGMPSVEIRGPEEFFTRLAADCADPLIWSGELYFELHRGTYTTQAANKRDNRRSEEALHDAEFLAALAHVTGRAAYPQNRITRAWELTCLNQFHDIIPGSSINEVYQDSARDYAGILATARAVSNESAAVLWPVSKAKSAGLLAINTLSFCRSEVVETPDGPRLLEAPSLGYAVSAAAGSPAPVAPVRVSRQGGSVTLENGLVHAEIDAAGKLVSFRDLRANRECLAPGGQGNQFALYEDKPLNWDAWDVDIFHLEKRILTGDVTRIEIAAADPLLARVAIDFTLTAGSSLKQTIILRAGSPVLEFACECDWHEEQQFLKVEFPLALRSDHATYEIQFGHVRRPTHFNTSWDWARFEVCAHRWADLSEPDFGVALLNDSKYGYACHGNVLRLSLLRAPNWPDPYADRGKHQFRYGLFPHAGGPQSGGVISAAAAFNQPLQARKTALPIGEAQSFFGVDHLAVVIDTVKKAEDSDDLIVRLYESHGTHVRASLTSCLPIQNAVRTNLLEDDLGAAKLQSGKIALELRPFEIRTIRLSVTSPSISASHGVQIQPLSQQSQRGFGFFRKGLAAGGVDRAPAGQGNR